MLINASQKSNAASGLNICSRDCIVVIIGKFSIFELLIQRLELD